MSSLHIWN